MPLFEYKCSKCGDKFEELIMGSSGEKGLKCPKCGSSKVDKQLSVFAISQGGGDCATETGGACGMAQSGCGPGGGTCPMNN